MTICAPYGEIIFLAEFLSFSFELHGIFGYNYEGLGDASQRTKLYAGIEYSTVRD